MGRHHGPRFALSLSQSLPDQRGLLRCHRPQQHDVRVGSVLAEVGEQVVQAGWLTGLVGGEEVITRYGSLVIQGNGERVMARRHGPHGSTR